jgi:hypothetical protein
MENPEAYLSLAAFYQKKRDFFLEGVKGSRFKPLPSRGTFFQNLCYDAVSEEKDMDLAMRLTALPHFKRYVPLAEAKEALAFWSSPEGSSIGRKLLKEIAERRTVTLLTTKELNTLDGFNKSAAGVAMGRMADDRSVDVSVLQAIGNYRLNSGVDLCVSVAKICR